MAGTRGRKGNARVFFALAGWSCHNISFLSADLPYIEQFAPHKLQVRGGVGLFITITM
jgi:hypothetical protein